MANSVDLDEMALHCLQRYLFWSAGMKGLTHYRLNQFTHTLYWKSPILILGISAGVILQLSEREKFLEISGFQGEVLVQILDFPRLSIHFHFSLGSR